MGIDMYDYSKFIKINFDIEFYAENNGQEIYYQIECLQDYKDIYAKRTIKKGEKGGHIHKQSCQYGIKSWIELGQVVGAPITFTGHIEPMTKDIIDHSCINDNICMVKEMIVFWNCHFGTSEPSIINAYLHHGNRIVEMLCELYHIEERYIEQLANPNDSQRIVLWTILGAISEAFLKLHLVAFRDFFQEFLECHKYKYDALRADHIITEFFQKGHISSEEKILLNKINGNRNMIHILNNESIYNYSKYKLYIEKMFQIAIKFFIMQKAKIEI